MDTMDSTAHPAGPRTGAPGAKIQDVTLGLLDYDWRAATGAPVKVPAVTQTASHQPGYGLFANPAASLGKCDSPDSPHLRRSDLAPGLVPEFFRSHLAAPIKAEPGYEIPSPAISLADVTASAPAFFASTGPQRPPKTMPMSVPVHHQPMPPQFDPAASMLDTLQAKLTGIQESIRAKPRTGYNTPSRAAVVGQPKPMDDILDRDFLALVQLEAPPASTFSALGKRTADVAELDEKAEDLKARNRASAKASRERKKAHLEKLHKQIDDLTSQNLELAQTCKELADDNATLRKELVDLGCDAKLGEELAAAKLLEAKSAPHRSPAAEVVPAITA